MSSLATAASAFVRRDFRIATSYKFNFVFQLTAGFFIVAAFYFISQLMDSAATRQHMGRLNTDYFSYVLIGIAAAGLMQTGLTGFAEQLRTGMTEGSLEMTFSTPARPTWILVLPCVWSFFFETFKAAIVVAIGIAFFHARLGQANWGGCLLVLLGTIASFSVFGIFSASLIIVLKRGDVVNIAFGAASSLIAGAYFPVELLPSWLGAIAKVLPMTYAYDGLRRTLLAGASTADVVPDLTVLYGFSLVGLPIAFAVAAFAIGKAKRDGSLGMF